MTRVKFRKGQQRKFINEVIGNVGAVSLRGLIQFGFKINYQTLKSYYIENRTLPEDFFDDLCTLAKIDKKSVKAKFLKDSWGQRLGGKH